MAKSKLATTTKNIQSVSINDQSGRKSALDKALKDIHKAFGSESVIKMSDAGNTTVKRISTGILSLDLMTGGGWPKGCIVELYGPESSGKTTIALQSVAEVQRNGGNVAYIDAENALDATYAKTLGVDIDDLLLSQPDSGEDAMNIVNALADSGAMDLIVVDSVAALVPRAEIEGEMGDSHVGLQARLMSQALRKLSGTVNKFGTILIFINQLREKVGVMFGNPEITPGGRALKFYASIRVEVRGSKQLKSPQSESSTIYGKETTVKTTKNKVFPPFKEAKLQMLFGSGLSRTGDIFENAVNRELIDKSGSWYSYAGERIGQGTQKAVAWLAEHPGVQEDLTQAIKSSGYLPPKKN